LGRKLSLIITDIVGIVGMVLTLFENIPCLLIGRLLIGTSIGLNSVLIPIYVNEMSPESISG